MRSHDLPVYKQKEKILKSIQDNQVLVVESPTGSGKTTQLPIILYEAGFSQQGVIGVTQPRRIATLSVCDYVAAQLQSSVGEKVGYKMRFEDRTAASTEIKVMTDGILLQEIKADPLLSRYSVMMVDEAHERSLNIDFILGLLKHVLEQRPDFKVIISSATINTEIFSNYFDACPVVHIDSQIFPVDIVYVPLKAHEMVEAMLREIVRVVEERIAAEASGDFLIFLAGEKNIKDCVLQLQNCRYADKLFILPLYGRLSKEEQELVFVDTPEGKYKVVVSTNIAETSLTIDGITTVIDSGLAKMNYYNPKTFTSSLIEGPISIASANQRKGRAGRTQPGVCYRMYSKEDFQARPMFTEEEIYRTDLSEVVLRMAELEITDYENFDFISSPGRQGILGAVETLKLLDAITKKRELSESGKLMCKYPLMPRHSRMIVEAIQKYPSVIDEVLIATAFLSAHTPFLLPAGEEMEARQAHHAFRTKEGDFITYLKLFKAYVKSKNKEDFCKTYYLDKKIMSELVSIKIQLEEITSEQGIPVLGGGSYEDYLKAVSRGLIQFICCQTRKGVYQSLTAGKIRIHPGSVMFHDAPQFIVAGEIVKTTRIFARSVSALKKHWLRDIHPDLVQLLDETTSVKSRTAAPDGSKVKRDTSWEINISGQVFKLERHKGKKKIAILPYEQFSKILNNPSQIFIDTNTAKIRAKVLFHSGYLLAGEKISTIVKVLQVINPQRDLVKNWPKTGNYTSAEPKDLCQQLFFVLKLCEGKRKNNDFNFIGLETDGYGHYWFSSSKSFHKALEQSLYSLEMMADELKGAPKDLRNTVNTAYRRITQFFSG